jgi:hypothetical protein
MKPCALIFLAIGAGFLSYAASRWLFPPPAQNRINTERRASAAPLIANQPTLLTTQLYLDLTAGKTLNYLPALNAAAAARDESLVNTLIDLWSRVEPGAALQWILAKQDETDHWAARDPAAALNAFRHIGRFAQLPAWLIFTRVDPARAQELVMEFSDVFAAAPAEGLATHCPAALGAIANMPAGADRANCAGTAFYTWCGEPDGFEPALSWWQRTTADLRMQTAISLASVILDLKDLPASLTPADADFLCNSLPNIQGQLKAFQEGYGLLLSDRDPSAALEWAEETLKGTTRLKVKQAAVQALFKKDPSAARNLAVNLPTGTEREEIIAYISNSVDALNENLAWVLSLPKSDPARLAGLRGIGLAWGAEDPVSMIQFISTTPMDELNEKFLNQATMLVPTGHCAEVLQALAARPNLPYDEAFCDHTSGKLVRSDTDEARTTLLTLPHGKPRASLVRALLEELWQRDTQAALDLANTLPSTDHSALQRSLTESHLSPAEKTRLAALLAR